jgi:hypothetical protein
MPGRQLEPSGEARSDSIGATTRCGDEELEAVTGYMCPVEAALRAAGALGVSVGDG